MPRAPQGTWVPKRAEGEAEEAEPEHVEPEVDPAKKWVDEGPQDCIREPKTLLKMFLTQRTVGDLNEAPLKWRTIESSAVMPEEAAEEKPPQREPGARRAAKQKQKQQRAAMLAQGYLDGALPMMPLPGGELEGDARARTLTGATDEGDDAAEGNLQPDPRLLAFLSNMQMAYSAQMYPVYGEDFTTVMLRNIPNRYTRDMLKERLDKAYEKEYDFLYLPIDFSNACNVGYCFINFRTPAACQRFMREFNGMKSQHVLPGFSSSKVCEVRAARVQGRDMNMENLRDESFIGKLISRPECQPLFFDEAGKELDFKETFGSVTGRKRKNSGNSSKAGGASPMVSPMGPAPMAYPPFAPWMPAMPHMPPSALDSRKLEFKMHVERAASAQGVPVPHGRAAGRGGPAKQARGGKNKAAAAQPDEARPGLGRQETEQVRGQIEFYFSMSNLCKDIYLRSHMTEAGWLPLEIIARFPKVKRFGATLEEVASAVRSSSLVEVDTGGARIRLRAGTPEEEAQRGAWAKVPESYKNTGGKGA